VKGATGQPYSVERVQDVTGSKKYTAAAFAQLVEGLGKKLTASSQTAEAYEMQVWAAKYAPGKQEGKQSKRAKSEDESTASQAGRKKQRKS
jgi:hypothetical protein